MRQSAETSPNDFSTIIEQMRGRKLTKTEMRRHVTAFLRERRKSGALPVFLRSMVMMMKTDRFLPERYAQFQPVIVDSLVFILSQLSATRLAAKIVDQICLPPAATAGERINILIKDMPTIQKLGQVIARSPGLDPAFRESLIELEDNLHTVRYARVGKIVQREVQKVGSKGRIRPEKRILSEATICVVIPAVVRMKGERSKTDSVIRVVKPSVRKYLKKDMALWDSLTDFLDRNKASWGMRDFNFAGSFQQVRRLIHNEVDLEAEQDNLATAARYYRSDTALVIPAVLPVSTPAMTVMSRLQGTKITSVADLTKRQRRRLAQALTRACILRPLQDLGGVSIFHGDPHAGNIAYTFQGREPHIIFYDWAMMGRLSRLERFLLAILSTGLFLGNAQLIFYAADIITQGQIAGDSKRRKYVMAFIHGMIEQKRNDGGRFFLTDIKILFEELTYLGITFPVNLMMFEKAVFTLNGVIADIDPAFAKNQFLAWNAVVRFLTDLVKMRFHRVMLEETWAFYRNRPDNLVEVQKMIVESLMKVGALRLKKTLSQFTLSSF